MLPALLAELRRLGCDNHLLAVARAESVAETIAMVDEPLYDAMAAGTAWEYGPYEQHQLLATIETTEDFDVVHSHLGWGGWALEGIPAVAARLLHTQHNPVTPDVEWFVGRHPDMRMSAVSAFQAGKLRRCGATRVSVVPNGLDFGTFRATDAGKAGLVFLGRLEREKEPDIAIRVARALGLPLALAGPQVNREFWDAEIAPQLADDVRYVGTVDHDAKQRLLGEAACALMPTRGEEGFGMVAIEAMACGTPVVALANGALPEVVDDGVTGFTAPDEAQLPALVERALSLEPAAVRAAAAERFDVRAAAEGYHALYREIVSSSTPRA